MGASLPATWSTTSLATACADARLPSTTVGSSASKPGWLRTASGRLPVTRASAREYLKKGTMR